MQARAADDLKRLVSDGLKAAGLEFTDARAFATPRRLALVVDGLPAARADVSEERRGPRVGAPEQAMQGFLKGAGLASLDQAEKRDTGKGEFWFAVIAEEGRADRRGAARHHRCRDEGAALAQVDEVGQRHHALGAAAAVHRGAVRRQGAGGRSGAGRRRWRRSRFGDTTRGHRFLSKGDDQGRGLRRLRGQAQGRARRARSGRAQEDHARGREQALRRRAGRAEGPTTACSTRSRAWSNGRCRCSAPSMRQFMDVPPEVLIVSMRTHQRYFVTDQDGRRARQPLRRRRQQRRRATAARTIVDGNERVLRSRLSDAKFFWDQDRKVTAGGAAAGAEGHRLPRQARHPGRARRAHRRPGRQARAVTCRAPIRRRRCWRRGSARPTS